MTKGLIADAFLACRAQLARIVLRIVPPQYIEDIVQANYVRVCENNTRNQIDEPTASMLSVARSLALDHVKRAEYKLTATFASDVVTLTCYLQSPRVRVLKNLLFESSKSRTAF